jgi:hypothetical protein
MAYLIKNFDVHGVMEHMYQILQRGRYAEKSAWIGANFKIEISSFF